MIYLVGFNSFIAKHIYTNLKKIFPEIILISHNEMDQIKPNQNDTVINCCGVNRGINQEEYQQGNFHFVKNLCKKLNGAYLIHFSSLMVHGFNTEPSEHQKWFIDSKKAGDEHIMNNCENYCIVRPSNVYGYDCRPYYNNLLTTLIYEKIRNLRTVNKLNKNCIRNLISVQAVATETVNLITEKRKGVFNIISNNNLSLEEVVHAIYSSTTSFEIQDGESNFILCQGENIVVEEDFSLEMESLERDMTIYHKLISNVTIHKLPSLIQAKGEMVEITSLASKRLYKITIAPNAIRGNHFHYVQIEDFFVNRGKVLFVLAYDSVPTVKYIFIAQKNDLISIHPLIIHTVCNDFLDNDPEIIISSTQEFIPNETPDTKYLAIL